jgi:predicted membrane channel-forming protein YqfA (hemolysin III family)
VSEFDTTGLVKYEVSTRTPSEERLTFFLGMVSCFGVVGFPMIFIGAATLTLLVSLIGVILFIMGVVGYMAWRWMFFQSVQQGRVDGFFPIFGRKYVRIRGYTRRDTLGTRWKRVSDEEYEKTSFTTFIDLR